MNLYIECLFFILHAKVNSKFFLPNLKKKITVHPLVKFQTAGSEQNNETENMVKLTVVFCNTREHLLMFENVVNCWVHYKVVSCMDQTQTEI